MKKLSLALAVTSALGASAANAAIVSEFGNGVLIPWTHYDDEGRTTAFGLTSCAAGTVYWTFFNDDSVHLRDDRFPITANQQVNLTWSEVAGASFEDQDGYLVLILDTAGPQGVTTNDNDTPLDPTDDFFELGDPGPADGFLGATDSTCLSGNAFYVDPVADDVSFIPAVPLNWVWDDVRPVNFRPGNVNTAIDDVFVSANLLDLGPFDIQGLWAGSRAGETLYMRYFKDDQPDFENDTRIYLWTTDFVGPRGPSPFEIQCVLENGGVRDVDVGRYTVFQYGLNQEAGPSVNLELQADELNIIDVEINDTCEALALGLTGVVNFMDPNRDDGFIQWRDIPSDTLSWSIVTSDGFDATQTLMNPSFVPHTSDGDNVFDAGERFNIIERFNPNGDFQGAPGNAGDDYGEGDDDDTDPPF